MTLNSLRTCHYKLMAIIIWCKQTKKMQLFECTNENDNVEN